jgi:transcriptional regulator with XRE-family HTH domain
MPQASGAKQDALLKNFGAAVRALRRKLGVSQERLAFAAELDRSYVSDVERGNRNVSLVNIVRIAEALRVTPSELLGWMPQAANDKRKSAPPATRMKR